MPRTKLDRPRIRRSVAFVLAAMAALLIVGRVAVRWLAAVDRKSLRLNGLEIALMAYPVIVAAVALFAVLVIVLGIVSSRFPSIRRLCASMVLEIVLVSSPVNERRVCSHHARLAAPNASHAARPEGTRIGIARAPRMTCTCWLWVNPARRGFPTATGSPSARS